MTFRVEKLPDEPIVIGTMDNPFDPRRDSQGVAEELAIILNKTDETVYYVADLRTLDISFSDLAVGLAESFKIPNSPYSNPRLKTFTVGSDDLVRIGVQAVKQGQYGSMPIQLFTSIEAALAQARAEIAKRA